MREVTDFHLSVSLCLLHMISLLLLFLGAMISGFYCLVYQLPSFTVSF